MEYESFMVNRVLRHLIQKGYITVPLYNPKDRNILFLNDNLQRFFTKNSGNIANHHAQRSDF